MSSQSSASSTSVPTWGAPAGRIVGVRCSSALRAMGIPYAKAARYARPEPVEDRPVIDARRSSPACPQAPMDLLEKLLWNPSAGMSEDEDCQKLSITIPADVTAQERVPVMVWIHGGSYTAGGGDARVFDINI